MFGSLWSCRESPMGRFKDAKLLLALKIANTGWLKNRIFK
jgi:hypothetical protein